MIGAALLAIPILSGSAAYAVAEAFGWKYGLPRTGAGPTVLFLWVIIVSTVIGMAINCIGIHPIDAYTSLLAPAGG